MKTTITTCLALSTLFASCSVLAAPTQGPEAVASLMSCTFTNGKHIKLIKANYDYSYVITNNTGAEELHLNTTEDYLMRDYTKSMSGFDANLYIPNGSYMYVVNTSEDNGGNYYGHVNIFKNNKQIGTWKCNTKTVKTRMDDESLVERIDTVD